MAYCFQLKDLTERFIELTGRKKTNILYPYVLFIRCICCGSAKAQCINRFLTLYKLLHY